MDILNSFKQNGYFTSEMYHLLSKKGLSEASDEIVPSSYLKEFRMTTAERLNNLKHIEVQNIIRNGNEAAEVVMSFTPNIIVFQNFKPSEVITAKFSVQNISTLPIFVNMVYKESSHFSIQPYHGHLLSRLAPGLEITFLITFTPVEFEDYMHNVSFETDKDQYMILLIALGPRPLFDFPDEVIMPKVPLKIEQRNIVTVHNVGIVPAGFTLNAKCPFSVIPKSAYLQPNEKIDISIRFKTMHVGDRWGKLYAVLESGENFCINLFGSTYTVNIELEKEIVRFSETYKSMVREISIKIINKSTHTLDYYSMLNENVIQDFENKIKLATVYYKLMEKESAKSRKLEEYDVLGSEEHDRVYTRIFFDEIQTLAADESFLYQNTHFDIRPIKGQLWPGRETYITLIFAPKDVGEFETTIFLDIDGINGRVPLKMTGTSLPPLIQLNLETLDMGSLYVNKTYYYELIATNKGHINGIIVYKDVPVLFGSCISCSPEIHCLKPGEEQTFVISFCNFNQGPLFEELNFTIRDSNVVLKLYLKGEIIYPSLTFSVACLDFGMVSLGVPKTLEFDVINESIVNVNATVKISTDGPEVSSIKLTDYAEAELPKPAMPEWPREFEVEPHTIQLGPQSRVSLKVTLTANLIRANQTALELELEKSHSPPIILPIIFNATVPTITPAPDIKLRVCFLEYPYKYELQLKSDAFWGHFVVADIEEGATMQCIIDVKEGLIEPDSTIYLPIVITTDVLGIQELDVRLHLFGLSKPIVACHVALCGVHPIITCIPLSLSWGQVKLLTRSQKILTLCNDSPVYVNYRTYLVYRDIITKWEIYPPEGTLEPESETDLTVYLYLVDADVYQNKAVICLEKVKDIVVPLTATGVGTSIVVDGNQERIFLGRYFTKLPFKRVVTMENKGTRLHSLEWSEFFKKPKIKAQSTAFYNLSPNIFKINSGEQIDLTITGTSYKATTVTETWFLIGSVEGVNKKELLLECEIIGEYVDPKIETYPLFLEFQYDYGPYNQYYKLTDIITIKNVSKLPLDFDICLKSPFAIIKKSTTYKVSSLEQDLCCCIRYDQSDINLSEINMSMPPHESRIFIDYLTLKPVELLHKSSLNFFHDIHKLKIAFNFTHCIEERLEDEEMMKIQVLLDTTKHPSLKSRTYIDFMKIKFKGHKNKDSVKLIGKINFPNVCFLPQRLDFNCLLNGNVENKTIKIENVTPIQVCYKLQWKKCIITSTMAHIAETKRDSFKISADTFTSDLSDTTCPQQPSLTQGEVINVFENIISPQLPNNSQLPIELLDTEFEKPNKFPKLEQVIIKTLPMIDTDNKDCFHWNLKFESNYKKYQTNEIFQLVPHRGILKPYETQQIQVIFKPKVDINVKAILECNVLGGPPESIIVTGLSSELEYTLNTKKINFKIRSFHENAIEELLIKNTALLPFEYKVYIPRENVINKMEGIIVEILPAEKCVQPEKQMNINVIVKPGVIGYFKRIFTLEIGHLPHLPIEVMGWGVFPQMYLFLDRKTVTNMSPVIEYEAISMLTVDYLQYVNENINDFSTARTNLFEKCFYDPDLRSEWHICSKRDRYPSVMDNELALERLLVMSHIKKRLEILDHFVNRSNRGVQCIPGFNTTPYIINYGVIITGTVEYRAIHVINYGPIISKLCISKGTEIPPWLTIKLCGKLNVGQIGTIEIMFSPTSESFPELEETVETSFNFEVPYGVAIPLIIQAVCAVPFLTSNTTNIDFGDVRCGDKVINSIPIKNVGKPVCIWYVTLKLKTVGPSPITVLDTSGKYESNEGGWLRVSFKPVMEMVYEGLLIFRFHMNPNKMTIPIRGQGLCPRVHIIGQNISFAPTLPYAETTNVYFGITNPCSFPIELIIAHSDKNWHIEEDIYNLLQNYYNKPSEMLVPTIKPGFGLPTEIISFYVNFKERVQRCLEKEAVAAAVTTGTARRDTLKKSKSPKSGRNAGKDVAPPRLYRTEAEIIADDIKTMKENQLDPLKDCLKSMDEHSTLTDDSHSNGLIIFFHGSPCEEIQAKEMAYSVGKKLSIPVINFDMSIGQALCTIQSAARDALVDVIEELYETCTKTISTTNKNDEETMENEFEFTDEFEELMKKLYTVTNINFGTLKSKQNQPKPKKKSPTSSTGGSRSAFSISTIFDSSALLDILTEYYNDKKFSRGFVIDTLTSVVVKTPSLVIHTVLKCKRTVVNIQLVLCHSDFTKWVRYYEEAQQEKDILEQSELKEYTVEEIDQIIEDFEDMDEDQFSNAPEELKKIYITYGLEARRQKFYDKYGLDVKSVTSKDKPNRSISLVENIDKKKIKKEEVAPTKKGDTSRSGKPTSEFLLMNTKYNEYAKFTYESLINLANNWLIEECELGYPLQTFNGQIVGATQKKTPKKSEIQLSEPINVISGEKGFPLTIITVPCLQYKLALSNMFLKSHTVQQALKEPKEDNILDHHVNQKAYTVLIQKSFPILPVIDSLTWKYLDEPIIRKCECNDLNNLYLLDDSTQYNILNILSKWHCVCGRKVASSQTSTSAILPSFDRESEDTSKSETSYPLPLRSVKSVCELGSRLVLQPGDLVRCKYSFNPRLEGTYNVKRYVEVNGWPDSRVSVNVTGICDLPRLDSRPKKMYDNFVRRKIEEKFYKLTYFDDLKYFEFGPIFIGNNRVYEENYSIKLRNCSLITANVKIQFLEDTNVFTIDQDFISLEPGAKGKLKFFAAPTIIGIHTNVLLFSIKDNPEILEVQVSCCGVVPTVDILPFTKLIDYGKLLLYRRGFDRFIVKNNSILPVMWKIRNVNDFVESFLIAHSSGVVSPNDNQVVPLTFIACEVGVIVNKILIIDVYDTEGRGDPMIVDTLYISAECYDVLIDCIYANPNETSLDFGNVKVNSTVAIEMSLSSKGKYNIYYKLKKVANFPQPALMNSMEVTPDCGIVPVAPKMMSIEVQCTPTTSMNLVNVPIFWCCLVDNNKDQVIVAKFPICITIASFYNTFTLYPLGELNFHIMPVGSGVIREAILNNTSKCPFTYEIVVPEEYRVDPEAVPPVEKPGKGKDNKVKNPPIKCGSFMIYNEDNLLLPGTSRTLQIHFLATATCTSEETIHFIISDTCPSEACGVPLKLVGTGAMPSLDFWNLENTFREHMIVNNLSNYKVHESSPHCVLVEDSVTLHFFCVSVNTKYVAAIDLYNNGLVPSVLTMLIHYQYNTTPNIFFINKYEVTIEPLKHRNLDITFAPKSLQEYRAVLEIKLKMFGKEEESFKICLIGEGVIPRIEIISPHIKQNKMGTLLFPTTCLGTNSQKSITLKNISSPKSIVTIYIVKQSYDKEIPFWLAPVPSCEHMLTSGLKGVRNVSAQLVIEPHKLCTVNIFYDPIKKGKSRCDVKITIEGNQYECYTILCEAEAFMEDIILYGLDMLPLEIGASGDWNSSTGSPTRSAAGGKKKSKSAPSDRKTTQKNNQKKSSLAIRPSWGDMSDEPAAVLKYVLDFGGCELGYIKKRNFIMANNSDKAYKFVWEVIDHIIMKPSIGYISPGEEKDFEIIFFSREPINLQEEGLTCKLMAISNNLLTIDSKGTAWDNNQTITVLEQSRTISFYERLEEHVFDCIPQSSETSLGTNIIFLLVSVVTEYTKYSCTLEEEISLPDTFIYKTRSFEFDMTNTGNIAMKVIWSFQFDEEFPARIDKVQVPVVENDEKPENNDLNVQSPNPKANASDVTLFSGRTNKDSVDTWFEVDLPFRIEPQKLYLKPNKSQTFKVTFAPMEAFNYKIRLKSAIENLNPYDQVVSTKITAKSLIPYCHLDMEESDYISAGRRKPSDIPLPPNMIVLEFNVIGSGCYKKKFKIINPTIEAYEFTFETVQDKRELVPIHCDQLKGYIEGGTFTEVTFTFAPTGPGIYESQWQFVIALYSLAIDIMVVGIVKEPDVIFVPLILNITNSLVGFTLKEEVKLRNNENMNLKFEFKGNSLRNDTGITPVVIEPSEGILKPLSDTPIRIIYTPATDRPLSFKIYCSVQHIIKHLVMCVNALSHSIKPQITYFLVNNEHVLNAQAITNIHLDKTAPTYERCVPFVIKNKGSTTFLYNWHYTSASIKKYLTINIEPRSGHVAPGEKVKSVLYVILKQVPIKEYPITLSISNGPEYKIFLHAEIDKPLYQFSCMEYNFGYSLVNVPDTTYKKCITLTNYDKDPIISHLDFDNLPELFVHYHAGFPIPPGEKLKITVYFRPKEIKEYEFKLKFHVNSLCEEIVTIRGEGVPLLVDLYEGCQKSFELGAIKVGEKIAQHIQVINHSKVAIDAHFVFRAMAEVDSDIANSEGTSICLSPSNAPSVLDTTLSRVKKLEMYKSEKTKVQIKTDAKNALASLKVVPNTAIIEPYRKLKLKILFIPTQIINKVNVQLNIIVLSYERPLVRLNGCSTGMKLFFSQNSLQFGSVRKHGCKLLKVMLKNKGDFDTRFWWQPLKSNDFQITPMTGAIAAHNNVTFSITFRPTDHNPFIKAWASCNIENYQSLELAMYGTCIDTGVMQSKTMYFECPVREVATDCITVVNPTDDVWLVSSELTGESFQSLKVFNVKPNSPFDIPIWFKPKTIGKHEGKVIYAPLSESALFVTLIGAAMHPNPNATINLTVSAKDTITENLLVHNLTEFPEVYTVRSEVIKTIPDKFAGYYEIKHPEIIKLWGEASATCRWTYACYDVCEMHVKVLFVNQKTSEYQFYMLIVTVVPSEIVDTITLVSRARETVQYNLPINNPLSDDVTFYIQTENLVCPEFLNIPRKSQEKLLMTFSPLVEGICEEFICVTNPLVGEYYYKMILKCLPAKEKEIEYTTVLGKCIPMRLRVENRSDVKADFICTVTHSSLIPERDYQLEPFEKGKFVVRFEPTDIGVQTGIIKFSSAVAGVFVFLFKGIATYPKPLGPIEIKIGGGTSIKFKNVFTDQKTFKFSVDQEDFYLKTTFEVLKPKKDCRITVFLNDLRLKPATELPTGSLIVECFEPSEPKVHWTYFLQGIL